MASIGNLVVNLTAKTDKFQRKMKQSQTTMQKFGAVAKSALRKGAAAAILAVGAAAAATAAQFQKLDVIAKTSDKLGIATEKMAGLGLAFEQTGVDAKAGMVALQRMTRRIADAANGAGPAAKTIKQLGLDARDLTRMTPDKALGRIADAMQNVTGQGEKVRIAFSLFDSEGVGLVNTLAAGSAGLRKFQRTAEGLNLAHTREELAQIEKANDAMNRVMKAVTGAFQEFAIATAPAIEAAAGFFQKVIQGWAGIFKAVGQAVGFTDAIDSIAVKAPPATATVDEMTEQMEAMAAAAEQATKRATEYAAAVEAAGDARWDFQSNQADQFAQSLESLKSPAELAAQDLAKFVKQVRLFVVPEQRQDFINQFIDKQSGFASAINAAKDDLAVLQGSVTRTDLMLSEMGKKGASTEQLDELRSVLDEIERMEREKDNAQKIKSRGLTPSQQRGSKEALTTILKAQQNTKKTPQVQEQQTTNKILRGMAAVLERQKERDVLVQEAVA
jgi:hypothetical protein